MKPMIDFFTYMKIKIPSETTIRKHLITKFAPKIIMRIIYSMKNKKIFLIETKLFFLEGISEYSLWFNIYATFIIVGRCLKTHSTFETIVREANGTTVKTKLYTRKFSVASIR